MKVIEWNAMYCYPCDDWMEPTCGDAKCEFCSTRPAKPSMIEEPNG